MCVSVYASSSPELEPKSIVFSLHVSGFVYAVSLWRSVNNSRDLVLAFHHVSSRDHILSMWSWRACEEVQAQLLSKVIRNSQADCPAPQLSSVPYCSNQRGYLGPLKT